MVTIKVRGSENSDPVKKAEVLHDLDNFKSPEEKRKFKKYLVLGYLSKGSTKIAAAQMAGINEATLYRWFNSDPEFRDRANACLGGEDEIIALTNISRAVRKGDMDATKFLLNKRRYYENRFDPRFANPNNILTAKNPSTGIYEVDDRDDVVEGLLGSEKVNIEEQDGKDLLEEALYMQDNIPEPDGSTEETQA